MPPTKKTYIPIVEARQQDNSLPVGRCEQILANRMQCWKSGDWLVTEELPETTAEGAETKAVKYQLCTMHMRMQTAADQLQLAQEEQAPAAPPEAPAPESKPENPITPDTSSNTGEVSGNLTSQSSTTGSSPTNPSTPPSVQPDDVHERMMAAIAAAKQPPVENVPPAQPTGEQQEAKAEAGQLPHDNPNDQIHA